MLCSILIARRPFLDPPVALGEESLQRWIPPLVGEDTNKSVALLDALLGKMEEDETLSNTRGTECADVLALLLLR